MKTKLILFSMLWAIAATAATSFLDTTFNPGSGADNGIIESALVLPSGKILVCGNFTMFNGTNASYMARLNTDGSLDTTFAPAPSYWVRTMALQSDGKIVIGGFFTSVAGQPRGLVARLNSDGSLDPSFAPGTGASGVLGVAIDGDADPFVFATAIQSDGKILITGNFTNYNGESINGICRLNTDGTRDTTFDVGSGFNYNSWGRSLLVQANGQIMATGWFTSYDNQNFSRMVRLNTDGSADKTFNPNFGLLSAVYGVQELSSGEYLAVGDTEATNTFLQCMGRLQQDGAFDSSFIGSANTKVETVRVQANGQIVIGGYFDHVDGVRQLNLARLNPDGSFDTNFTPSVDNFVWSAAIQSDKKIIVVGGFQNVEGQPRAGIARLLPNAGSTTGGGGGTGGTPTNTFQTAAGTYQGLFYDADSFTNADAGLMNVTLGVHGGYTASLRLGAAAYSWSGVFNNTNLNAQHTINRGRNADAINVTLELADGGSLAGSVDIGSLSAILTAYKNSFTRANPATAYAGRYTGLLTPGGAPNEPTGDGDFVFVVNNNGTFSLAGVLADGTAISRSGSLSANGLAPFYVSYGAGKSVALGWIGAGSSLQGTIYWGKSAFETALNVDGAPYVAPKGRNTAITLSNALVTVSGGDLTNAISASFTFEPVARFVFPRGAANTNHFSITLNDANGVFSGQFVNPATHRAEGFRGVVLQNGNLGAGSVGVKGGRVTFGVPQ
jgi:uncharacterized delta-60 repeat protein